MQDIPPPHTYTQMVECMTVDLDQVFRSRLWHQIMVTENYLLEAANWQVGDSRLVTHPWLQSRCGTNQITSKYVSSPCGIGRIGVPCQ